jgi:hypothetical protein
MEILPGLEHDAWHRLRLPGAFEWWEFAALSDDGETALRAAWFDGCPLSPDYQAKVAHEGARSAAASSIDPTDFCAFRLVLARRDWTRSCLVFNQYPRQAFLASETPPAINIGGNAWRASADSERWTFTLSINSETVGPRGRVRGQLVFGSGPFEAAGVAPRRPGTSTTLSDDPIWNPVALNCGVTGDLAVFGPRGRDLLRLRFLGRGMHDHRMGRRPLTQQVHQWFRICFWFGPYAMVLERFEGSPEADAASVLWVLDRNRLLHVETDLDWGAPAWRRIGWGWRLPEPLVVRGRNVEIVLSDLSPFQRSPTDLQAWASARVEGDIAGERIHAKTTALFEWARPVRLRSAWVRWRVRRRIRRPEGADEPWRE